MVAVDPGGGSCDGSVAELRRSASPAVPRGSAGQHRSHRGRPGVRRARRRGGARGSGPAAARLDVPGRRRPGACPLARLGPAAARHRHHRPEAALVRAGRADHPRRDDRAYPGARRVRPRRSRAALRVGGGHGRRRRRERDLAGGSRDRARPPQPPGPGSAPLPGVRRAPVRPGHAQGHPRRRAMRAAAERVPAAALPHDPPAGSAAPLDDHQGRLGLEVPRRQERAPHLRQPAAQAPG
jgi:hypothetical protein